MVPLPRHNLLTAIVEFCVMTHHNGTYTAKLLLQVVKTDQSYKVGTYVDPQISKTSVAATGGNRYKGCVGLRSNDNTRGVHSNPENNVRIMAVRSCDMFCFAMYSV